MQGKSLLKHVYPPEMSIEWYLAHVSSESTSTTTEELHLLNSVRASHEVSQLALM